jgi:hypothetical protein
MKKIIILSLLVVSGMVFFTACNTQPKFTKAQTIQKIAEVQSKLDICKTQWYDIYEKGLIEDLPGAEKLFAEAKAAFASGDTVKGIDLLAKADTALNKYSKAKMPEYEPTTPLANPADLGNIHKATIKDLQAMEFLGIPRWNYWFNFVGKADDGTLYMAYAYINHHGTGKFVPPAVFTYSTEKDSGKFTKIKFTGEPKLIDTKDSRTWLLNDGDNQLTYILKDGKIEVKYKSPDIAIDLALTTKFSFWYNKGVTPPEFLPGASMAGFEEPGFAEGSFVIKGQKILVKGFGESENLSCGGTDYRSGLIKYGNEWWVTFNSDQVAGLVIFGGKYKDAGLFIEGKYVIPSSIKIVPIEANKSFTMVLQTSAGEVSLSFYCWGWDPSLYEHWATCDGTFKGKPITNGYAWLEHIPQGGQNGSPPVGGRKGTAEKQ